MTHPVVTAHPPDLSSQLAEAGVVVAEAAGFRRATWSVVLGVEEQHQDLAVQIAAASGDSILVFEGNLWRLIACFEGHFASFVFWPAA